MTPYPDVVTNRGHVQVPARNGPGRTRPPTVDRESARSRSQRGPNAHHARPATTRRAREPATVPSRSTRRTRPVGAAQRSGLRALRATLPDPSVQPARAAGALPAVRGSQPHLRCLSRRRQDRRERRERRRDHRRPGVPTCSTSRVPLVLEQELGLVFQRENCQTICSLSGRTITVPSPGRHPSWSRKIRPPELARNRSPVVR